MSENILLYIKSLDAINCICRGVSNNLAYYIYIYIILEIIQTPHPLPSVFYENILQTNRIRRKKNSRYSDPSQKLVQSVSFIKNVSSSTSHKKLRLSVCLYMNLRKFFLTHSFMNRNLIEIYMNFSIMNTQIFYLFKYDLNGH